VENLGQINNRRILYINVRSDPNWPDKLPFDTWVVFTIADEQDEALLIDAVPKCLDKQVTYTCSARQLAGLGEHLFDIEIVNRAIAEEDKTGKPHDYETSPLTTMHQNFSEGFWFATTLAFDGYKEINTVVCLDFTTKGVKRHLVELIKKINVGWLPSDKEIEEPIYDS
jgi:hypothetical protein